MSSSRDQRREERQYRGPNFRSESGQLYLVRCFACSEDGTENYIGAVAAGLCAWCGWRDGDPISLSGPSSEKGGGLDE